MKRTLFRIGKAILSLVIFPLWFIKLFVGVGHLPDASGEIVEVIFRHSAFENIADGMHPILAYASMVLAASSAVISLISLKHGACRTVRILSNTLFGVAVGAFLVLLLAASTVTRGY